MKKNEVLQDDDVMATVVWLPKDSKKIKLKAKLCDGSKAVMELNHNEIIEARNNYILLDPDDNAFARYKPTPLFQSFLEETGSDFTDLNAWEEYKKKHGE